MKNEKKHIDRLFQEGLKNFEATPSDSVWKNVSEQLLIRDKQRKVIPLWIKLSAIAASLLLLITLGNKFLFQNGNTTPEVKETIVDNEMKKEQNSKDSNNTFDLNTINTDDSNSENLVESDSNSNDDATKKNSKEASVNKNESIVAKNDGSTASKNKKTNTPLQNKTVKETGISNTASETVAVNQNTEKTNSAESQKNAVENEYSKTSDVNSTIAKAETKVNKVDKAEKSEPGKMDIQDALAENNKIKEVEEQLTEDEKLKRWSVNPTIAPVYFNTLGSGSSMDAEFVNNTKSGDINMSYGVSASYAINDKINVRVGVNNVKLGYNTHDVFYNSSNPIKSVAVKGVVIDKTPAQLASVTIAGMSFSQVPEPLSNQFNASINQELGFLEIPLEIQYKITNTKLGVNLIGGFSALFLNNNEIFSTLDGNSTLVGKATNINNLSYSANLGLGLNYKVSNQINLNLEPMFKYQLNTFRNTSGNFKPYFIGVYSGLSFKF